MSDKKEISKSSRSEIDAFLNKVATTPVVKKPGERGRLVFAMDATASREATWDQATQIQAEMFRETASLGGLDIQLVYYRGFGEFFASSWVSSSETLLQTMTGVSCVGGFTQIGKVLQHSLKETQRQKVNAVVFVGDCMEEDVDRLCHLAGQLAFQGVPVFIFHEGDDAVAAKTFRQIAQITNGACCPFDRRSAQQLKDLLSAVAVYAAGGYKALQDFHQRKGSVILQLMHKK
ncbi:MAG: VWA domain-containing protein [Gammaproteobacteria bacterium]|jgi:hypothetical protein|nr:VWA domain-containing protein [Gammaproteobacteria bacterium]